MKINNRFATRFIEAVVLALYTTSSLALPIAAQLAVSDFVEVQAERGRPLTDWQTAQHSVYNSTSRSLLSMGMRINAHPLSNITYQEGNAQYSVYEVIGLPGAGFVMRATGDVSVGQGWFSVFRQAYFTGASPHPLVPLTPVPPPVSTPPYLLFSEAKVEFQYRFIATGERFVAGQTSVKPQNIGFVLFDTVSGKTESTIGLTSFTVSSVLPVCEPIVTQKIVPMGSVSTKRFQGLSSTVNGEAVTITLSCSSNFDPGSRINVEMTDLNNPANNTPNLSLLNTSMDNAQGIAVRFLKSSGEVIRYREKWQIAISQGREQSFTLTPQYIQIGQLIGRGRAEARAGITFTYD